MALKLTALALAAAITLAGVATAQTVDPNVAPGVRDAPRATAEQLRVRNRRVIVPGDGTPPQMQRMCVSRSDGGPVTGVRMRVGLGVTFNRCEISQSTPVGSSCECAGQSGSVLDVPV